ncbi:Type I secretion target repeat protein [Sulfitobacter noctilucae]|uniref:cadherin-like domain-containing protein n=1 Tax=Sulfitobacter noctilucae TaxID=1342302 RepID=UPI000467F219|nr:cadherin-like domain-containing protein [Sulfitobacter noctilucae]KIN60885.1 Type I secretion target repeat protein [Sulfitobacter noctilucae]
MIRTLDFNAFPAGTVIDDEYLESDGVTVSAVSNGAPVDQAMTFDSNNPTGDDTDLASDTLDGLLIISGDGDSDDPDDFDGGGSIFFDFDDVVQIKSLTFKDIEETSGDGVRMIFYGEDGSVISNQFVPPTGDGGETTVQLFVPGTSRMEVVLPGSGAIDNLVFDDELPVDESPTAVDDSGETDESTAVTIDLRGNDTDPNDPIETLTIGDFVSPNGTVEDNGDGTVTFTPEDGFTGEATFTYVLRDPNGNSDIGEITVQVNEAGVVNTPPDAVDDSDETDAGTPITVDLLANDTDAETPTADLTVTEATVPAAEGSLVNNGDGTVTFTPAADFTGVATISYTIADPQGATDSAVHTIAVVDPVDPSPVAVDDTAETPEDTAITIDVLENDTDPDTPAEDLTVTSADVPEEQGTVVVNPDNTVTFTPADDYNGPATITYVVSDPEGNTDEGSVAVTVTPVNDAPDAVDDADATPYNTPVTVDLLANDTDVDNTRAELTVTEATVPAEQGTLDDNGDGTVTFTPVDGFTGEATISYTIADPDGLTDSAVHTITVQDGMRDGIVDGTDGDDLIDTEYAGDPDGDFIDNEDALIPGQEPNDDIVRAGDGDDTVQAGEGDDSVTGGEGNDSIFGEDGSDTVDGGTGDDFIDTSGPDLAPDDGYPFADGDSLGFDGDVDPENDRDSVDGGVGNDTIRTGDDNDTITGGDGDDVIDGGIDDDDIQGNDGADRIVGGEGDDTILGGGGDDTIYAGNDPDGVGDLLDITDEDTGGFSPDRNPDNGRDFVQGGAGNDLIFGADDDDTLEGGSGNDTIDGQIDDDLIRGGSGDDSLMGGQGNDSIDGGTGDDYLEGGTGNDTLRGNRNEDTIIGGNGDDVLDGGGENDLLEGGDGDDNLQGALGDDTMRGGEGADTMTGGGGQDVFEDVGAGDDIDGGSGPIDFDTLDLRGSTPEGGSFSITYTSDDREDGVVNYLDADGENAGQLVFEEIENIIPCFTPGTKIATPKGERLVEELQVGDRVITRDNGIQEIRWVGARDMSGAELEKAAHLKPVLIREGALGNDLPERDMMVSPNHRVLVANDKTALYFEEREVLVAAKHLTGLEGVDIVDVSHTTYIHIMFDQHEVILSDGTWTESFQPGDMSLAGIGNAQRQEILELFPELATQDGIDGYASARRSLKKHEAKLITK